VHPAGEGLLAKHAHRLGLERFDEQDPVTITVVDPVRTAVEKLVLLENAAADPDEQRRQAVARHYYDVWCLLQHTAPPGSSCNARDWPPRSPARW